MSNLPYRFPEAYQAGTDACIAADGDASKVDNPYPLPEPGVWCQGGNEWHAWNRGWNDTRPYTSDWPPKARGMVQ